MHTPVAHACRASPSGVRLDQAHEGSRVFLSVEDDARNRISVIARPEALNEAWLRLGQRHDRLMQSSLLLCRLGRVHRPDRDECTFAHGNHLSQSDVALSDPRNRASRNIHDHTGKRNNNDEPLETAGRNGDRAFSPNLCRSSSIP